MNKRDINLPSISTLLTSSPPPIIVINDEEQQQQQQSNFTLSPILSPISPNTEKYPQPSLPSPSMLSLPPSSNHSIPPLQGDDPPRRLRHPSISSIGSTTSSTSSHYNTSSLWSSLHNGLGITSPNHSIASSRQFSPSPSISRSPSPLPSQEEERSPLPPSTQIILSESGQPILKRRRGRPPSLKEPSLEGGWTFLTPTVWDVKSQEDEDEDIDTLEEEEQQQQQQQQQNNDTLMNGSMAAFTSSNMDMVLQMPRKKRGRKPKTHIVGNSCFVWKDITAAKRSTKVTKPQQQQQQKSFRRLEPTI